MSVRESVLQQSALITIALMVLSGSILRAHAQVSVSSTTPSSAEQGTVNLNVTINGKGFKKGAKAQWFVSGTTNPGGVTVNSTAFVNLTQLTANITVSDTAVIGNFDVYVTSGGRTGKGTELFAVLAKGSAPSKSCVQPPMLAPTVNSCGTNAAGCLDASFGNAGVAVEPQYASGLVAMQGSQIIVAGQQVSSYPFSVARFNADGTQDTSFGTSGGYTQISANGSHSLIVNGDGSILLLVDGAVYRLLANGQLDSSFGTGGRVAISSVGVPAVGTSAMALQSNGYILIGGAVASGGRIGSQVWGITRLEPVHGQVDLSFGSSGLVTLNPTGQKNGSSSVWSLGTQIINGQELIVAAGNNFTIARFTLSGALDKSFGPNGTGIVSNGFGLNNEIPTALHVDSSNRIIVAGMGAPANCAGDDWEIARLTAGGLPDTSFGSSNALSGIGNGRVEVDFYADNDLLHDFALEPNASGTQSVVGVGSARDSSTGITYSVVLRLNDDGTFDNTFGAAGAALRTGHARSVRIQPDGKIIVNGEVLVSGTTNSPVLLRYWDVAH